MCMAAKAKSAVDQNAVSSAGRLSERCFQRRSQQCNDFRQHDGYVQLGLGIHPTSRPF
jgi:hypothetical protein